MISRSFPQADKLIIINVLYQRCYVQFVLQPAFYFMLIFFSVPVATYINNWKVVTIVCTLMAKASAVEICQASLDMVCHCISCGVQTALQSW